LFIYFNPSSKQKPGSNEFLVHPYRQILTSRPVILLTTRQENETGSAPSILKIMLLKYFFKHGTRLALIPANGKLTNSSRQRFTFSFFDEPAPGKS